MCRICKREREYELVDGLCDRCFDVIETVRRAQEARYAYEANRQRNPANG